jgi:two-component system phosphate regulon sensor histidine kinase PhoR
LLIRNEDLRELPAIRIENYRGILLGLILPQMLFALILLGISTSALIIAYRSLGKQLILNKLRDDFIANISHELKTPVSTVKIALEALGNYNPENDPEVTREYLAMAQSETDRLEKLVERVLNHEALLGPLAKESLESCDMGVITQSIVNSMKIPILEKRAVVKVEEMASPILVEADKVYLEGMIMNLLDNSLKYSGSKPQIVIQISSGPSGSTLSVRDNGPGIPDEYNKLVFDKFFRVPSGDRHNVKGYGLGLSFASRVMKQLGGAISFKNLPGEGCEFTLHFPNKPR